MNSFSREKKLGPEKKWQNISLEQVQSEHLS